MGAPETLLATAAEAEAGGDYDRALGFYRALVELQPDRPRWRLNCVRVLQLAGREPEAAEALKATLRQWPRLLSRPEFKAMLQVGGEDGRAARDALGANCPPDEALKRPPVEDDGKSDLVGVRGGRDAVVLVFTGLADRMVMPLPLFDRYLAELDLSAIYLRDQRRIGYLNGIKSLGPDYAGAVAGLKTAIDALGARQVFTFGNSAGGIGALSYGLDLGAKHMIGLSAPVRLIDGTEDFDQRAVNFTERMRAIPEARRDFRARLSQPAPHGDVHLYYGADSLEDRLHAEALRGLPGVNLYPLPGLAGHGALFRLAQTGRLRQLLNRFFGDAAADATAQAAAS